MKKTYYKLRTYSGIVKRDLKGKFPISFSKKLKMWNNGFLAEKYVLYQMDKYSCKDFLSDYNASMSRWINEPFNEILSNKYIFSNIVGKYIKVPEIYGLIIRGIYYPQSNIDLEYILSEKNDIIKFVMKPVDGGGGQGVFIITKNIDGSFIVNSGNKTKNQLLDMVKTMDNYLLTEYAQQCSFQKSLNPDSVNTMRVLTLIDPNTNKPFIVQAVQRVGTKKSQPQDNFTKGGLSFNINLETGILSDATTHPKTKKHIRHSVHPDTGLKIEGLQVPGWKDIYDEIQQLAENLPQLKCIGWDFLMTNNGLVAIEGNHHPDPDILQGHGPLLTNEKVKRFYQYYGIV